jgi:serine protease Do
MKRGVNIKIQLLALGVLGLLLVSGACARAPVTVAGVPTSAQVDSDPTASPAVDFVAAVAQVMPSVVKIEVTYGPQGAPDDPQARAGAGSGWVFRGDGLIVTNAHVVDGAQTVTIILPDGTKQPATAVQADASNDIAVVRIATGNMPPVVTGDSSKLELGQPVAALGNALNMGIRVTTGVISQLNVTMSPGGEQLTDLIETDTIINPGNSGGVLVTISGEVIGIPNSGLQDPNLDVEGFGYAISINKAMPVINGLIAKLP